MDEHVTYSALAGKQTPVPLHPSVARISVMLDYRLPEGQAPETVEIAFFNAEGDWILETIEEFAQYAEPEYSARETGQRVYPGVPLDEVLTWVKQYRGREISLRRNAGAQHPDITLETGR